MGAPRGSRESTIASLVRQRIERGGERLWRLDDFSDLPVSAVAQALSRLARNGIIERASKGIYYRSRQTALGKSRPNPIAIRHLASQRKDIFPSGLAAANLLGFTTQQGKTSEVATSSLSLPRKLVGQDTVIHTRRPEAWSSLSETDAALLDFLRHGGRFSELNEQDTNRKMLSLLSERDRFNRFLRIADTEPPRVRAILGAFGDRLGADQKALTSLRATLNPLTRFDFGIFAGLPTAHAWQAKERQK
jgi:hypothetical protein